MKSKTTFTSHVKVNRGCRERLLETLANRVQKIEYLPTWIPSILGWKDEITELCKYNNSYIFIVTVIIVIYWNQFSKGLARKLIIFSIAQRKRSVFS